MTAWRRAAREDLLPTLAPWVVSRVVVLVALAIARDIARSHGGDIILAESPMGGLRATVDGASVGSDAAALRDAFMAMTKTDAFREHAKHLREQTVPHVHLGIDWIDIFLGGMCFTEAWAKYLDHGHLARPTILLGITMIAFGLFGGKLIAWKQRRAD